MERDWTGWDSHLAHPDAPMGAGGPGSFSRFPLGEESKHLPNPWSPRGRGSVALDQSDTPPPNLPPATQPRVVGTFKRASNAVYDVEVKAEVIADARALRSHTDFTQVDFYAPGTETNPNGRIVSFDGKFVWKGTITIQTVFGDDPKTLACYGRGTTAADIRNGDVTLGFHEHCHQDAFIRYLNKHRLPNPPQMRVGMKLVTYEANYNAFEAAIKQYWNNMRTISNSEVDDVGYTLAEYRKYGCYRR